MDKEIEMPDMRSNSGFIIMYFMSTMLLKSCTAWSGLVYPLNGKGNPLAHSLYCTKK